MCRQQQDAPAQEAKIMIQHLKTIKDSEGANQTPDRASKVMERLVTAYNRKCNDAARSEKVSIPVIADSHLITLRKREREDIVQ
jgi:GTP cyclohydrolase I